MLEKEINQILAARGERRENVFDGCAGKKALIYPQACCNIRSVQEPHTKNRIRGGESKYWDHVQARKGVGCISE